MDYELQRLSWRSFEQLVQALASAVVAPGFAIFGDGPDGGREASYNGRIPYPSESERWDGLTIIQAKFRQRPQSTKADTNWALELLEQELVKAFGRHARPLRPNNFIFATNVNLSSTPETGGKARAEEIASRFPLGGFDVWDYDRIRTFLDGARDVRAAYLGYICPGDVLVQLSEHLGGSPPQFDRVLTNFLEKELAEDQFANLEQAGRVHEEQVPISRVFVDLPTNARANTDHGEIIADLLELASERLDPASQAADMSWGPSSDTMAGRMVLIGGPGQGKTTVGKFICQLFRASLLQHRPPELLTPEARAAIRLILDQCDEEGIPIPAVRRFPIRIPLTSFSESLSSDDPPDSLLEFIARLISKRASMTLSVDVFRAWLATYPWLLVLDGLDEVPASGNRDAVLNAIRDFWVDATGDSSDVLVLATTRPQGYNEDFSPETYRHVTLSPLSEEEALHYGRRLVQARYGDEGRQEKVIARLKRATQSPATANLMTTPLQVTILATLFDRIGEPPRMRSKLFSEYYGVIYARERERDGAASPILRDHKPDIDKIHHRVALVLQVDDERTPRKVAKMSHHTFAAIVHARLEEEGHTDEELEALAAEIIRAATDRLVFLVGLEADEVGFEIRSLQEFMAAEALMDERDTHVIERLRAIAGITSWRNVFLLAAGRCYDEEQYLRDTINTVCSQLNDTVEDPLASIFFPGSVLATDLLADDMARSQPTYSRLLADEALRKLPSASFGQRLADVYQPSMESVYKPALEQALKIPERRRGGLSTLLSLSNSGIDWADDLLGREISPSRSGLLEVLEAVPSSRLECGWLGALVTRTIGTLSLADIQRHARTLQLLTTYSSRATDRLSSLVSDPDSMRKSEFVPVDLPRGHFAFTLHQVGTTGDTTLSTIPATQLDSLTRQWAGLHAAASFARSPSSSELATQLRALAKDTPPDDWATLIQIAPWPLAAALAAADEKCSQLTELSKRAEQGELGEYSDWELAEKRWSYEGVRLTDIQHRPDHLGCFDKDIGIRGFPLEAAGWSASANGAGSARRVLLAWLEAVANPATKEQLARLVLNVGAGRKPTRGDRFPSASRFARAILDLNPSSIGSQPLLSATRLAWSERLSQAEIALLDAFGQALGPVIEWDREDLRPDVELTARLAANWNEGSQSSGLFRILALLLAPAHEGTGVISAPLPELVRQNPGAAGLLVIKSPWRDHGHIREAIQEMGKVAIDEPVWLSDTLRVVSQHDADPAAEHVLATIWEMIGPSRRDSVADSLVRQCERVAAHLVNRRSTQFADPDVWSRLALFDRPPATKPAKARA